MLNRIKLSYQNLIAVIVAVSTLTAFAIIPSVPATVPSFLLIMITCGIFFINPANTHRYKTALIEFVLFIAVFGAFVIISQLSNLIFPVSLPQTLLLIDPSNYTTLFFRSSLFTQSAYLICNAFLYILIKNYGDERLLKAIHWGFGLLVAYGIYEFVYYLVFKSSGDFVSNRIYSNQDEGIVGGSFQLQNIGAINLLRIKGFTGEPSMYAFSTLPYFALLVGLKKRWQAAVCFVCLLLAFSTTALLGLFVYAFYLMFFSSNIKLRLTIASVIAFIIIVIAIFLAYNENVRELLNAIIIDKLSGNSVSGDERGSFFRATFNFWANSDILHFLFGYGFGYVRSFDFFSTLLFNVGLLGFLGFTGFVFRHFLIPIQNKDIRDNYRGAVLALYCVMMTSVPEFAYCSFWVILASGYILKNYNSNKEYAAHQL